jgi:hypothetical protein
MFKVVMFMKLLYINVLATDNNRIHWSVLVAISVSVFCIGIDNLFYI